MNSRRVPNDVVVSLSYHQFAAVYHVDQWKDQQQKMEDMGFGFKHLDAEVQIGAESDFGGNA